MQRRLLCSSSKRQRFSEAGMDVESSGERQACMGTMIGDQQQLAAMLPAHFPSRRRIPSARGAADLENSPPLAGFLVCCCWQISGHLCRVMHLSVGPRTGTGA
jgi:hypothetical protein